jgi:hypothetical protein
VKTDSPSPWFQQFTEFQCRDCGSGVAFRSRRRSLVERYIMPLLLLKPVRCGECFRREYSLVFTEVKQRLSEVSRMPVAKVEQPAAIKRNVA